MIKIEFEHADEGVNCRMKIPSENTPEEVLRYFVGMMITYGYTAYSISEALNNLNIEFSPEVTSQVISLDDYE